MRKSLLAVMGVVLLLLILGAVTSVRGAGYTYRVNSTSDIDDDSCEALPSTADCTLREAIREANDDEVDSTIVFNIPTGDPGYEVSGISGTWTISLTAGLPVLTDTGTTIDGLTQATFIGGDPNPLGPEIEITGGSLASVSCLSIDSDQNKIRGLVINRCPWDGIRILIGGDANEISGNYIGPDATGTLDLGNGVSGVTILASAQNNVVGGDTTEERNVLSGNDLYGVYISGSGTTSNTISGNYIGTDATGTADLGNGSAGIRIMAGSHDNVVGGDSPGERNVISGNGGDGVDGDGVDIDVGGTTGNTISGNYIGIDAAGSSDLGNRGSGVYVTGGSQGNLVGGDTAGERNVISGNDQYGVLISVGGTTGNTISGNYIGTDATGTVDLGNTGPGVFIRGGAQDNVVGGDTAGERNVISGNDQYGVYIAHPGTTGNTISGNYIGTNITGTAKLGNFSAGIFIGSDAHDNVIGGDTAGERNVISGNGGDGVLISGGGTASNTVSGNYIGTDVAGTAKVGNGSAGVSITSGCHDNLVGGDTAGERNVISGNDEDGVLISGGGTTGNTISGNYIGTDPTGTADLGNIWNGVFIAGGAHDNVIGGDIAGERNVISGNAHGVYISDSGTMSNTITGNYIGTDASGALYLGNSGDGVYIADGAQSNVIGGGTVGESNVIAFNDFHGVRVDGTTTTGNTITENSIHSNGGLGILLMNGGNTELTAPTIALADCLSLYFGTAPSNATVELFTGPDEEGKTYLTTVSADGGGDWILWDSFTLDTYVTASATDAAGNTSEFSTQVSPGPCHQLFAPLVTKNY